MLLSCPNNAKADSLMQALFDLEATNSELKQDLRDLYITSAAEIDVGSTRKAIVIHVRLQHQPSMQASVDQLLLVGCTCHNGYQAHLLRQSFAELALYQHQAAQAGIGMSADQLAGLVKFNIEYPFCSGTWHQR